MGYEAWNSNLTNYMMNWPTIQSSSIREEINSIQCSSDSIILVNNNTYSLQKDQYEQVSNEIDHQNQLNSVIDRIPSIKALLILRRYQLLKNTDEIKEIELENNKEFMDTKNRSLLLSLLEQYTFNTNINSITPDCQDRRDSIRSSILSCYGETMEYINIIQNLKETPSFSLHIHPNELATIPYPSSTQIEKDLTRESLIVNGIPVEGVQGLKHIRKTIASMIHSKPEVLTEQILQRISRTRIGEYCYNELVRLFPIQEGTLLIVVDNKDNKPIEIQMNSKIFENKGDLVWGVCVNCSFVFTYSFIFINDITNHTEEVGKVNLHCQMWSCFGMDEFEGQNSSDNGYITVSIE